MHLHGQPTSADGRLAGSRGGLFSVAFVCTGNRARSPIAAELVRTLGAGLPVAVASYGTLEMGAVPALPQALAAAAKHGLDLSAHVTRPLSTVDLRGVDLVLGFERFHVSMSVVEAGARRDCAFTLPELTMWLREVPGAEPRGGVDPVEHARHVVALSAATRARALNRVLVPEIRDPFGGRRSAYERVADEIVELGQELVERLFPAERSISWRPTRPGEQPRTGS